jgi:hypothetical protein
MASLRFNSLTKFSPTLIALSTAIIASLPVQAAIMDGRTTAPPYTESKNPNYQTIPTLLLIRIKNHESFSVKTD